MFRLSFTAFLWGSRKLGGTTPLKQQFGQARYFDLLKNKLRTSLLLRPDLLREEVIAGRFDLVIMDEVQCVIRSESATHSGDESATQSDVFPATHSGGKSATYSGA